MTKIRRIIVSTLITILYTGAPLLADHLILIRDVNSPGQFFFFLWRLPHGAMYILSCGLDQVRPVCVDRETAIFTLIYIILAIIVFSTSMLVTSTFERKRLDKNG